MSITPYTIKTNETDTLEIYGISQIEMDYLIEIGVLKLEQKCDELKRYNLIVDVNALEEYDDFDTNSENIQKLISHLLYEIDVEHVRLIWKFE